MQSFCIIILLLFIAIILLAIALSRDGFARLRSIDGVYRGAGGQRDIVKDLKRNPRSKSEAAVIAELEKITGQQFPTVYPSWLVWRGKRLELDGYNGKDLALEFSGPLHTKWYPDREPYEVYFKRVINDAAKLKICRANGVHLIVVDMSLPRRHWNAYLRSRLFDAGRLDVRPDNYIVEETAMPFRNTQLEKQLGLDKEFDALDAL